MSVLPAGLLYERWALGHSLLQPHVKLTLNTLCSIRVIVSSAPACLKQGAPFVCSAEAHPYGSYIQFSGV